MLLSSSDQDGKGCGFMKMLALFAFFAEAVEQFLGAKEVQGVVQVQAFDAVEEVVVVLKISEGFYISAPSISIWA